MRRTRQPLAAVLFTVNVSIALAPLALAQSPTPTPLPTIRFLGTPDIRTPGPDGPDPSPGRGAASRCALWDQEATEAMTIGLALQAGTVRSDMPMTADGIQVITECRLPERPAADMADLLGPEGQAIVDAFGDSTYREVADAVGDGFHIDGSPFTDPPDPALDVIGAFQGRVTLNGRRARQTRAALDDLVDSGVRVTSGTGSFDFLEAGDYDLTFLRTAGSFYAKIPGPRTWQIGFMGNDPDRTVPTRIPDTVPLSGARHVVTYGQYLLDGDPTRAAGLSDFGIDDLGPGGTQYYNVPGEVIVIETPNGPLFITQASLNPLGYRPMTYDGTTMAWIACRHPMGRWPSSPRTVPPWRRGIPP